jgi:hypothetical protein
MTGIEIYRVKDIARAFYVTPRTVRRWIADGLLKPRGYRKRGGKSLELIFTSAELNEFMDCYLIPLGPAPWEAPMSVKGRAEELSGIIGMLRLYAGKATAAKAAKAFKVK